MSKTRERTDRCPGVLRPWSADDGALIRLRPVGGLVSSRSLIDLIGVAETFGDGQIHLTSRANIQVRGLPTDRHDALTGEVVAAIEATGLLPSRTHELVRNVMVSPRSGFWGGRANLRPVAARLDALLCSDPALSGLPGRFLFVLDDGRGDLLDRNLDLGLIAVSSTVAQLRIGSTQWGEIVPLADAANVLVDLARRFLTVRGTGPDAPWHVDELDQALELPRPRHQDTVVYQPSVAAGEVQGGFHHVAVDGSVGRALLERAVADCDEVVVTPWRGLFVPERTP